MGGLLHLLGAEAAGRQVWRAAVALLAADLTVEVVRTVIVDRHLGVDTIALVAMLGALALGEELAGAVIGLMFSGGAALEAAASRRARRELTRLVERAPRVARLRIGDALHEVPVDAVGPGDVVLVRTGEVIPVDGTVVSAEAVVDTSTLSGEPLPVTLRSGMTVMSGTANAGAPSTCAPTARPRERLRGARAARRAGAGSAPVRADGRPLRRDLPAGHARRRRAGLGAQRRPGARRWPSWSSPRRAR